MQRQGGIIFGDSKDAREGCPGPQGDERDGDCRLLGLHVRESVTAPGRRRAIRSWFGELGSAPVCEPQAGSSPPRLDGGEMPGTALCSTAEEPEPFPARLEGVPLPAFPAACCESQSSVGSTASS